ncbi:MAG: SPFH domain-containing protein [Parvularculaceae bacterium]
MAAKSIRSLSQGEARIYRKSVWPHQYKIRFARDPFEPAFAERIDAGDHVSLAGAGDTARFSPASLALQNGALSLQTATLSLGPVRAQTSDGVAVVVHAIIEFRIIENRKLIERMLREGKFRSLGAVFADRCRAAISSEIGRMHYGQAIEHQGANCASLREALNDSVNDLVNGDADGLGIAVSSANIRVEGKGETGSPGAVTPRQPDFDLPNTARRIHRFLREENPNREALLWIERNIERLILLERTRMLSSGNAVIVAVDGAERDIANLNAADYYALSQASRKNVSDNVSDDDDVIDVRAEEPEPPKKAQG